MNEHRLDNLLVKSIYCTIRSRDDQGMNEPNNVLIYFSTETKKETG